MQLKKQLNTKNAFYLRAMLNPEKGAGTLTQQLVAYTKQQVIDLVNLEISVYVRSAANPAIHFNKKGVLKHYATKLARLNVILTAVSK